MRETHLGPEVLNGLDADKIDDWIHILYYEGEKAKREQAESEAKARR